MEEKVLRFYTIISDETLYGIEIGLNNIDLKEKDLQIHGTPFKGEHGEWCLLISYDNN